VKADVGLARCAKDKEDANDHDWISRNTSDPDANFGQKNFGNKKWYGYKSHANHDVVTELATAVVTTAASSSDTLQLEALVDKEREARGEDAIRKQGGDKGYVGNRDMLQARDILDYTIPKKKMYAECERKARNTQYLYVKHRRYKVEQKQAEGKRWHHLGRARYRGRWKVHLQGLFTYLVMNLKRIVNPLLPLVTA